MSVPLQLLEAAAPPVTEQRQSDFVRDWTIAGLGPRSEMMSKKTTTALMVLTLPWWLPPVLLGSILGSLARLLWDGLAAGWAEPMGFLPDRWTNGNGN